MTVIAWDGKTLAADGRTTTGQMVVSDAAVKVRSVKGMLFGRWIQGTQNLEEATEMFEDTNQTGARHV